MNLIKYFQQLFQVCIIWFTVEYLARFAVCTEKYKFIREPLNLIDSLTIIPFYLEVLLHVAGEYTFL